MLKIALVISSTRDTRFADKPAKWIFDLANARDDLDVEIVDIKEFDLPFFNAPASNAWTRR
jgi:NAD(P)H-dependent FMN reductase